MQKVKIRSNQTNDHQVTKRSVLPAPQPIDILTWNILVCETVRRMHVVEDDIANCKQDKLEVCLQRDGCPTVPKTTCTISKQNTTKEYSDTQVLSLLVPHFSLG